ncbi:ABC transporter permease [Streptomyces sp. NPDC004111]|uniref:ABC transporter permease n=1 Tax=Streptomyces sp. NPDC004111 TaxID=3364690 RepID=UPI0036B7E992
MSALGRVVRSGVGRRRVPTVVIVLATLMTTAASILAGSLLAASSRPFDTAFARQHGAHLTVRYADGAASDDRLAATAGSAGVADSAGPFRTTTITPRSPGMAARPGGGPGPESGPPLSLPELPLTVVGRDRPADGVDDLVLTSGRWAARPGEIVLAGGSGGFPGPGLRLDFPDLPGRPALTVVGTARSVTGSADGWVTPGQLAALTPPGRDGGRQMLYRFTGADTAGQVAAGHRAVTAGLPAKAVSGTQSWLTVRRSAERDTALYVPFLVAFGTLGLVMSVLIVGNVVAATVGAGTRRIGILKAIGFTPAQVVRAYVGQALLPAAAGTALGVLVGHLLALPVLAEAAEAYRTAGLGVEPWIDAAVVAGVLGLTAVTAWASAARAGRLRTVEALSVGRTPRPGRGRWAARAAARLPVSRPVGLGLARPFARPGRALAMCVAIVFGATAVTFTVGLGSSLQRIMAAREHADADVVVDVREFGERASGPREPAREADAPAPPAGGRAAEAGALRAITAQPGTRTYYSESTGRASLAGISGSVAVVGFTGDASWGGYAMVSGRWLGGPGEAVVPTGLLTTTGKRVGDGLTVNGRTGDVTLRIVGEVLDPRHDGMQVFTDTATLTTAVPDLVPAAHNIALKSGTSRESYIEALDKDLRPLGLAARPGGPDGGSEMVVTLNVLSGFLTLMLVAVAALGVLNSVVLDTRERIRELGTHKALGMTPRQTIALVLTSVVVTGLIGGALGVPLGVALHGWIVPAMGEGAGLRLPGSVLSVYGAPELALLGLGGLLIATAGALLPAGWAARTRTAVALRTE